MTSIQPELWIDRAAEAVDFYGAAFGAQVLHRVGAGNDIVAQMAVGDAIFWVATASTDLSRFSPNAIGGTTSRLLLVCSQPAALLSRAVAAGATLVAAVAEEHGWQVGRVVDPYGHEWEIGRPLAG